MNSGGRARGRTTATIGTVALAVVLSGCILTTESDISIAADGSGSATQTFLYDDDVARLVGPASQFERDVLDAQAAGADVEILDPEDLDAPYTNGLRYVADFDGIDGLEDVLTDGVFDTAEVTLIDGLLTIEAVLEGDEDLGADGFDLTGVATARVTIEVEGDVVEANSDSSSGSTHTWRFDASEGGRLRMVAQLESGGVPVALAAGGGAVLIGLLLLFRRRRAAGGSPPAGVADTGSEG